MDRYEYPGLASASAAPLPPTELAEQRQKMKDSFFGITQHAPGDSEELRAFGLAALTCLMDADRYPEFNEVVDSLISSRPDLEVEHQAQLLRIACQYELKNAPKSADPDYPAEGKSPDKWIDWFDTILTDQYHRGSLEDALWTKVNQANDPKRYAGPKLAILAHKAMFDEPIAMVDSGCSAGLGQIQIGENLAFNKVNFKAVKYLRYLLHGMLETDLEIGANVGFDKVPNTDWRWVEACSYYPHEYADKTKQKQREELYRARGNFRILHGDITKGPGSPELEAVQAQTPTGRFDVGMSVTSMYEVDVEDRDQALRNLESLATGLVVIQDVAEIHPDDPTRLVFASDIYAPSAHYNLFSKIVDKPGQPYEKLGRWNNFRCHTFTPTRTLLDKMLRQL